jgi:hypothetical protein
LTSCKKLNRSKLHRTTKKKQEEATPSYLDEIDLRGSDAEHGDIEKLKGENNGLDRSKEVVQNAGQALGHTGKSGQIVKVDRRVRLQILRQL